MEDKKFEVSISETRWCSQIISASSKDEAIRKAMTDYMSKECGLSPVFIENVVYSADKVGPFGVPLGLSANEEYVPC